MSIEFYKLPERYKKVIKKDVLNGETMYLREDLWNSIVKPYKFNIVGRTGRIGLSEVKPTDSTLYKWVYCSALCKK